MKKIIKLTESDLTRIVKRTIKEQDEMEDMSISITERDVFNQVTEVLDDMGGYNVDMEEEIMGLSKEIMNDLRGDLSMVLANYITENYDGFLHNLLDNEGYDDEY
jgi:hypothetical protein